METTAETVQASRATLSEIEQRIVRVNDALLRMRLAIERRDFEAIVGLRSLAEELNRTIGRALAEIGAADSLRADDHREQ